MARPVRKILLAFALCLSQLAATSSMAVPILWTFSGATFDDGGGASGSFVYDAPSNTYSALDITTTAGSSFGGAAYHAVHPHFGTPSSSHLTASPIAAGDFTGVPAFLLAYTSALTDLGGTVALGGATILELQCTTANCSAGNGLRELISGSLVATLPVRFVLQGVAFDDGGTASGSLLYYPSANKYGGVNITTTAGSAFGGTQYDLVQAGGSDATQFTGLDGNSKIVFIQFSTPLPSSEADAIGFDSFIVGTEGQCSDAACSTSTPLRDVSGGSVSAAVPVPSSLVLGLLGGFALLVARRRRERLPLAQRF